MEPSAIQVPVRAVAQGRSRTLADLVTVEEPLEIRLSRGADDEGRGITVTMRTPGRDAELALGLLFCEGVIRRRADVLEAAHVDAPGPDALSRNIFRVVLAPHVNFDVEMLARNFVTSSACGLCGKTSIAAVSVQIPEDLPRNGLTLSGAALQRLPGRLREKQEDFSRTGGLHASGLFSSAGDVLAACEDVGRHNALDKLIGACFLDGGLPLRERGLILSGRASFELIQKAAMAGIVFVAAIGPPSSLAVALAADLGITLVGFLGEARFNVYAHPERIEV